MAHVEHALDGAMNAAAAGNGALAAAKTLATWKAAVAAAAVAGAVGLGGGYELGRAAPPRGTDKAIAESTTPAATQAPRVAPAAPIAPIAGGSAPAPAAAAAPADMCAAAQVVATNKCSAQKPGETVTFAIKSRCSETSLDVFWVDETCHEVFRGILAPGAMFWQDSWEGHVFRVRDHATHQLVNEFTPARVEGAVDRDKYWKGARTELPLVVVHEGDKPLPEAPVPECTRGGGRAAMLHVRNERKSEAVALMRVDFDCRETGRSQIIAPGTVADVGTSEGHAFRVRDASGALLLDIVPTFLDTSTYITVP